MSQDRAIFRQFISDSLAKNPAWLGEALFAVSDGMERAVQDLREQRARYDLAFRSALAIAHPDRLTRSSKLVLNEAIVGAISEAGMSPAEREWLNQARSKIEGAENG
jgi:hypothetical protein